MFIRVITRIQDINEDLLLQNIPPSKAEFVWAVKYISIYDIEDFEALASEKTKKTVIYREDKSTLVIRENVDQFAKRLEEEIRRAEKSTGEESEEEDNEEVQDSEESSEES